MKLLHIDSSILGGQSVSRQLTASIVAHLKQTTPGLEITYRDLAVAPVPQQSPTIQFAKMKALYEAGALPGHRRNGGCRRAGWCHGRCIDLG